MDPAYGTGHVRRHAFRNPHCEYHRRTSGLPTELTPSDALAYVGPFVADRCVKIGA